MVYFFIGFFVGLLFSSVGIGPIYLGIMHFSVQSKYRQALGLACGNILVGFAYLNAAFFGAGVLLRRYPKLIFFSEAFGLMIAWVVAFFLITKRFQLFDFEKKQKKAIHFQLLRGDMGF